MTENDRKVVPLQARRCAEQSFCVEQDHILHLRTLAELLTLKSRLRRNVDRLDDWARAAAPLRRRVRAESNARRGSKAVVDVIESDSRLTVRDFAENADKRERGQGRIFQSRDRQDASVGTAHGFLVTLTSAFESEQNRQRSTEPRDRAWRDHRHDRRRARQIACSISRVDDRIRLRLHRRSSVVVVGARSRLRGCRPMAAHGGEAAHGGQYSSGTFNVGGSGADNWGTAHTSKTCSSRLPGDYSIASPSRAFSTRCNVQWRPARPVTSLVPRDPVDGATLGAPLPWSRYLRRLHVLGRHDVDDCQRGDHFGGFYGLRRTRPLQ
jgi:hypothetical protein